MSISSVGNYGYYPQVPLYNVRATVPYVGQVGFRGGAAAAEQLPEEQPEEQKGGSKGLLIGTGLAAGAVFLLTRGKGKGLLTRLGNLFKGSKNAATGVKPLVIPAAEEVKVAQTGVKPLLLPAAEEVKVVQTGVKPLLLPAAEEVKVTQKALKPKKVKVKVKPQRHITGEHVNLPSGRKVKMKNAGGKKAIHKVRRNEKQIIQKMLEQAQAEKFTAKDLAQYHKSLGKEATATERAYMRLHNKPAAEKMADVIEHNGLKVVDGQLVKEVTPQVVKPIQAAGVDVSKLLEEKTKLEGLIAKYSKPGMERWAKPHIQKLQKIEEQLAKLNS